MTTETYPTHRVPPHNLEAEVSVLGSILLDNHAMNGGPYHARAVSEFITAESFYREANRKIFTAMDALLKRGTPVDTVTLTEELRTRNQLEEVGGVAYLVGLGDAVSMSVYASHYAQIVAEKAALRAMIAVASKTMQLAFDEASNPTEIALRGADMLTRIAESGSSAEFQTLPDLATQALDDALTGRADRGIPFGFRELDALTLGMHAGEMIVVAAASSMGKTAWLVDVALNAAVHHGVRVGLFSLEMSARQLVQRALAREARVDMHRMRSGFLTAPDRERLIVAHKRLSQAGVVFDDLNGLTVTEMENRMRLMHRKHGVAFIGVDYLQLVTGSKDARNREQEVSSVSRAIKGIAKELRIPIMTLSQINEEHEREKDKRPRGQKNVRESKAVYHDADQFMFIHRPDYYDRASEKAGIAEIILTKNRHGPTGTVDLQFHAQHVRFNELERGLDL